MPFPHTKQSNEKYIFYPVVIQSVIEVCGIMGTMKRTFDRIMEREKVHGRKTNAYM